MSVGFFSTTVLILNQNNVTRFLSSFMRIKTVTMHLEKWHFLNLMAHYWESQCVAHRVLFTLLCDIESVTSLPILGC